MIFVDVVLFGRGCGVTCAQEDIFAVGGMMYVGKAQNEVSPTHTQAITSLCRFT